MERQDKIDAIIEFLDDNHVKIVDTTNIGAVMVDAELSLNKEDTELEFNELLEKGLTEKDIESFNNFIEKNTLMMIKVDVISGVSFENCEYYVEGLGETDLWSDEEKEEKEADEN